MSVSLSTGRHTLRVQFIS